MFACLVPGVLSWWLADRVSSPAGRVRGPVKVTRQPESTPARRVSDLPVENLFQLTPRLYSGGGPEGDAAFAALARLGIRTLISVDGAPPDVERARRHGLEYVHLPIGYDGVRSEQLPFLLKAVRELPGPVLVHCHHGRHRGPAAAALCAVGAEGWTRAQALAWLGQAGTDPGYRGLYRDVAQLPLPEPRVTQGLPPRFPAQVPQRGLVEAMVALDGVAERLKAAGKQDWEGTDERGRAPVEAALELWEGYRELARDSSLETRGAGFGDLLKQATQNAGRLQQLLAADRRAGVVSEVGAVRSTAGLEAAWQQVSRDCKTCHQQFRDNTGRP